MLDSIEEKVRQGKKDQALAANRKRNASLRAVRYQKETFRRDTGQASEVETFDNPITANLVYERKIAEAKELLEICGGLGKVIDKMGQDIKSIKRTLDL